MRPALLPSPYLTDILAQPAVLGDVARALSVTAEPLAAAALHSGRLRRVVLTGMGSSLHALYPLHLELTRQGIASFWLETSELLLGFGRLIAADTLLVAASQSGESAEIVNLALRAGEFGHSIAVTNYPASALGRAVQTVLPLQAGPEATVSCKTYLATLAVAHWLGAALTAADRAAAAAALVSVETEAAAYLRHVEYHVDELAPLTAGVRSVFVTGRGVSLATAGTGGLILKESTLQPAEGMSGAAFRHGPLEMAGPHVLVLVLEGESRIAPLQRRLATDIAAAGGRVGWVSAVDPSHEAFRLPEVPTAMLPLVEILPVQMLSLALAARDGREAGRFERASKVTTIE